MVRSGKYRGQLITMTRISPPLITNEGSNDRMQTQRSRKIVYPRQAVRVDRKKEVLSFVAGADILLVCPKNCGTITLTITEGQRRGK